LDDNPAAEIGLLGTPGSLRRGFMTNAAKKKTISVESTKASGEPKELRRRVVGDNAGRDRCEALWRELLRSA
jgi:hypothetical protein